MVPMFIKVIHKSHPNLKKINEEALLTYWCSQIKKTCLIKSAWKMFSRVLPVLNFKMIDIYGLYYVRYNIADSIARATRHYYKFQSYLYQYSPHMSMTTTHKVAVRLCWIYKTH